jgi:TetR/AcrR family transcriptional regulator, cholesterol catabolism regulator
VPCRPSSGRLAKSKARFEEVVDEIFCQKGCAATSVQDAATSLDGDAFDKLSFVVERHLRGADARLAKVRVFYREAAALSPERLSEVIADRDTYEHSLRKIIIIGQAEGTFAPHLDPTLTSIAILALLNSVQQWFRPDGPRTLDDVIDAFTDLILRSVALNSDMAARKRSGQANPTKDTELQ